MKAGISTEIKTSEAVMWNELQKVSSLRRVSSPILTFEPQKEHSVPELWELGIEYRLNLSLFGFIPLGQHIIELASLDRAKGTIASNKHGSLAKTWNHVIKFETIDDETIRYMDEIEIEAGLLTIPIWLFAHLFYRHRQRRWKVLVEKL